MGSALPRPEGLLKMEYVPREQFVPFHKRKQRHSVLVTHRRCGKTAPLFCDLIGKAIKHPPARQGFEGGRFAHIANDIRRWKRHCLGNVESLQPAVHRRTAEWREERELIFCSDSKSIQRSVKRACSRQACAIPTGWRGNLKPGVLWTVVNERDELGTTSLR